MKATTDWSTSPIGIAGAGRVAQALGQLLRDSGEPVVCIASHAPSHAFDAASSIGPGVEAVTYTGLAERASRILICVPDAAIENVAALLESFNGIALHTCGAKGPEALASLRARGVACGVLHPLQSISEGAGAASLVGICFAVSGDEPAVAWAEQIAAAARGRILRIPERSRPLYHAAAVMASNYLAALLAAAQELMGAAGIAPEEEALDALAPLARTSLENALRRGPACALTGPIERGDSATVAAHLSALDEAASETVRRLYRAAGLQTLNLAGRKGLPPGQAAALERILRTE